MEDIAKESRIVHCPECGHETDIRVFEDTLLLNFPLYCPYCGKHLMVDIMKFKIARSDISHRELEI